jgi:hypothetical protein
VLEEGKRAVAPGTTAAIEPGEGDHRAQWGEQGVFCDAQC